MASGKKRRKVRLPRAGAAPLAKKKLKTYAGHGVRFDYPADMTVSAEVVPAGGGEGEFAMISARLVRDGEESPFLLIEVHPSSVPVPDILAVLYKETAEEDSGRGASGEKWTEPEEKPVRDIMGAMRTGRALMAKAEDGAGARKEHEGQVPSNGAYRSWEAAGSWVKKEIYALPGRTLNLGVYVCYLTEESRERLADRCFNVILGSLQETGEGAPAAAGADAEGVEARAAGRKAVYAGSFDPVTNGHLYMIREGARLFDEFVVAVGTNPDKRYTFSVEERLKMLESVTTGMDNVEVECMPAVYLVDFARSAGASYVLRGVRNEHDFLYERTMRNVNADLGPEITTVFLMPPREIAEVSSSFVKGLVGAAGWERVVANYLPPEVCEVFRRKFGE